MKTNLFRKPWFIIGACFVAALLCVQADEFDELNCKATSENDTNNNQGFEVSGCPDACYYWEIVPTMDYCLADEGAGNCAYCYKRKNVDGATKKYYYGDCDISDDTVTPIQYGCLNTDGDPDEEVPTDEVYTETGTDCELCDESTGEPI